jgi:hypothetical protein
VDDLGSPIWFSPFGLEELVPSTPRGTKGELEGVVVNLFSFPLLRKEKRD